MNSQRILGFEGSYTVPFSVFDESFSVSECSREREEREREIQVLRERERERERRIKNI
jgi:hypothetical protein